MTRYIDVDELLKLLRVKISIMRSKLRAIDPTDVIYNPNEMLTKDFIDGAIYGINSAIMDVYSIMADAQENDDEKEVKETLLDASKALTSWGDLLESLLK